MVFILPVLFVALTIEGVFSVCTNPTCSSPPCAASLLEDCGCTTVSGTAVYTHELINKGDTIASGSHVYSPFEAGFTSDQKSVIEAWGCSDASVTYDSAGGIDLGTATSEVAYKCGINFPRLDTTSDTYYGIVGSCGGHVEDYHFHGSLSCLYEHSGGHSTQIAEIADKFMYGKWEDYDNNLLPLLDACGGHFGVNPDSNNAVVYHYHTQDKAPFTIGCHGPTADDTLVSVSACRALYTSDCSNDDAEDITLSTGTISYDRWCPCWDASGSNTGSITELPAIGTTNISYEADSSELVLYGINAYTTCTSDCSSSSSSSSSTDSGSTDSGSTGSTDKASHGFSSFGIAVVVLLRLNHL